MTASTEPEFACRTCGGALRLHDGEFRCADCDETVPIVDGIPRFPVPDEAAADGDSFDVLAPIYESPLWFRPLYRAIGGPTAPRDDRAAIVRLLEPTGSDALGERTVLDAACGTGRFTRYVAARAGHATGVDVSAGMLERARRYAAREGIENASFARMSVDRLWFDDAAFDRAACCWAIHLFPDPAAALDELRRVLRPGGRLAGTTIVDHGLLAVPGVRMGARAAIGADAFGVDEFRALLGGAGFAGIELDRRGAALFFGARAERDR